MNRFIVALVFFCLVFGCAKNTTDSQHDDKDNDLSQEIVLKVDERVIVSGTELAIEFTSVTEDSRCPIDVVCIWAGNGEIELILHTPGSPVTVAKLNTFQEPREISYSGYQIKLKDLKPYPKEGIEIDPTEYQATLVIYREM